MVLTVRVIVNSLFSHGTIIKYIEALVMGHSQIFLKLISINSTGNFTRVQSTFLLSEAQNIMESEISHFERGHQELLKYFFHMFMKCNVLTDLCTMQKRLFFLCSALSVLRYILPLQLLFVITIC